MIPLNSLTLATQPPNTAIRSPGLDLLRAMAVLMVLVYHFSIESHGLLGAIGRYGWMGVDLFFALSGYLIGGQLFRPISVGRQLPFGVFLRRRLYRTLPNFLVVLAVYFYFPNLREQPALPPLWKYLTFTQNLGLDRSKTGAFSHAWSLCVEEQFYFLLPLFSVFAFRKKMSARHIVSLLVGLLFAGMIIRGFAWNWLVKPLQEPGRHFGSVYLEYIYYPTSARLDGLLVGVSLALIKIFRREIWEGLLEKGYSALALSCVLLTIACVVSNHDDSLMTSVFLYPLASLGFGALILASLSPRCIIFRLKIPGVSLLATLSFGIYLVQKLVFGWARTQLPKFGISPFSTSGFLITMLSCALVAAVLYFLVERPFLILRDSLDSSRLKFITKPEARFD